MFALNILTLGIYRLYWFIKTRKEMMTINPNIKILSPWFFVIPVIVVVVAFSVLIVNVVQNISRVPSYCDSYTTSQSSEQTIPAECEANPGIWQILVFYLAIFIVGPIIAVWLWGYSKGVEKITNEKTSFAMAMIVLLLVPDGIDILIIQDGFNKLNPVTPATV